MIERKFKGTPKLTDLASNEEAQRFLQGGEGAKVVEEKKPEEKAPTVVETAKPMTSTDNQDSNASSYPWINASAETRVQHITRIPEQLKKLLDYLGQTTFDENMTSICTKGMTNIAKELAEARNLPLPDSFGSWNKK